MKQTFLIRENDPRTPIWLTDLLKVTRSRRLDTFSSRDVPISILHQIAQSAQVNPATTINMVSTALLAGFSAHQNDKDFLINIDSDDLVTLDTLVAAELQYNYFGIQNYISPINGYIKLWLKKVGNSHEN